VQAKFDPAVVIQVGAADMPWIPFVEDVYGQRYVDKTITDVNKVGNSADWGVFLHGDLPGGIVSYAVAAVDGAGYKTPDRSKGFDYEGRVSAKYMGFTAAAGGYTGKEGKDFQQTPTPTLHNATRADALVAYSNSMFHVGLEYFQATNWAVTAVNKQDGFSAFGTYNFMPQWAVFGRYDWGRPTNITSGALHLNASERLSYFNVGLQYEPAKLVDLALVYKHDAITHLAASGSYSDGNTKLVAPTGGGSAHYDEVGLFTQFKF
jgi:hypothetical protein